MFSTAAKLTAGSGWGEGSTLLGAWPLLGSVCSLEAGMILVNEFSTGNVTVRG